MTQTSSAAIVVRGSLALGLGLLGGGVDAQTRSNADVVVKGERAGPTPGLSKLTQPLIDVPQAVSQIDAEELERRGVTSLTDAIRTTPGISLGAGETSWQGNNVILRGFTTRNDVFLDGMRDYGYYFRDPFNAASLEIIKGPSSVLFGRGATGGVLHQVSKQPELASSAAPSLAVGSDGTFRATLDVNQPLGAGVAARVNAMAHHSGVAGRDGALSRRWGVAPSLALGLGSDTRVTLGYFRQSERNRPDYGIPWFNGAPAKVARQSFFGFRDDYLNTDVDIATAKIEHAFSGALSVRGQLRYSSDRRVFRTSEAVIPAGTLSTTPLSVIRVTRNEFSGNSTDRFAQGQLDATARFSTASIGHTLVVGAETGREHPSPAYIFHIGVIGTTLVDPPEQEFAQVSQYIRLDADSRSDTLGVYMLDTLVFGRGFEALAGLRWDRVKSDYLSTGFAPDGTVITRTALSRTDSKLSGRGALVFKPSTASRIYLTYANSFNPSADGIESLVSSGRTVAQANVNTAPETSTIWESGSKHLLLRGRMLLTTAIFRITKANVRIPDGSNPGFNINGGKQRVQGVELEVSGRLADAWMLHAGYAFLDSATLRTDNPAASGSPKIGAPLPITPRNSASVQVDYLFGRSFSLGAGAVYQTSRLAQNTNASVLRAPGYMVFELRGRARIADQFSLQANIYNVADKVYYDQLHPFHVVPGAGRSALLSLIVKSDRP